VYVPITDKTQPNPYLVDSLRELITLQGLTLTKINPAFMTRQISEINNSNYKLQFHITSLKPLRPGNKADTWEKEALESFEKDEKEVLELIENDSASVYRYMAPLQTEKSCLKCHEQQGYKVGDVRGGISVTFPSKIYLSGMKKLLGSLAFIHLFLLGCGILGITLYFKTSNKYFAIINTKNEELSKSNAFKDMFFSIVAHDLRNPFISILGYIDILKKDYKTLSDEERDNFIEVIQNSTKSSFQLLDNLQLWAKSQRAKLELNIVDLNLKQLVSEAVSPYLLGAEMKNINIHFQVSDDLYINADKFTMERVIANLFSNAIKYTHKSGKIEINAEPQNENILFYIKDYGLGISKDKIAKLFHIQHAYSTRGTENEEGTGLGLILCKEFIEKNKGQIWVESELGKGAQFFITIKGYKHT
jgi:hypothetical protein